MGFEAKPFGVYAFHKQGPVGGQRERPRPYVNGRNPKRGKKKGRERRTPLGQIPEGEEPEEGQAETVEPKQQKTRKEGFRGKGPRSQP